MNNFTAHLRFLMLCAMAIFYTTFAYAQPDADVRSPQKDQVIMDDLIVDGSLCVGFDCVNGESFGFDTIRLKENNLRIRAQDTSTSASFPTNDWQITFNDTANGGANKFSIDDIDGGRTPFTIEAGARSHALYVDSGGDIGIGTNTPVTDIHVKTGDTPTLRLEQDGSSGFTPQTWDLAGNEANFFVRDVTNGSKLPFRIKPNAPTDALVIAANGNVTLKTADSKFGIGTDNPSVALHIVSSNPAQRYKSTTASASGYAQIRSNIQADLLFEADNDNSELGSNIIFEVDGTERFVIESNGDLVHNGVVLHMSDKRLKSNIKKFDKGIKEVLQLNPVEYEFTKESELNYESPQVGLIAQELQKLVPELVKEVGVGEQVDELGNPKDRKEYLGIVENEIPYLLINAIKDQHEIIDSHADQIDLLKKENLELRDMIKNLERAIDKIAFNNVEIDGENLSDRLTQNIPNPFDGDTRIEYFIQDISGKASINIMDLSGKLIRSVPISESGKGVLNVRAYDLPAGTYTYSLVVDGELIDTKKMILSR